MEENSYIYFKKMNIKSLDYSKLKKIGAGHDGIVYKYHDFAIKILKHNEKYIEENNLMTLKKAMFFEEQLNLLRFAKPIDIVTNEEDSYIGYVMNYLHDITKDEKSSLYRKVGEYKCSDLSKSIIDLRKDFIEMTSYNIVPIDLNRNSYIYTNNFMYICDMDKFKKKSNASILNRNSLNFIISKFLFYEIKKLDNYNKSDLKLISKWCKYMINKSSFIDSLLEELVREKENTIEDFVYKKKNNIINGG